MHHVTPLIGTVVGGIVLAFILSALCVRIRISPLIGYLLAGVIVGPFTPGYVADQAIANELAEIGVILLMFGVGLHFSLKDLMAVKNIAIPGALVQIAAAIALGAGMAVWMGWSFEGALVFGLALSVASTVVLLRALQTRRLVETERGKIAIGWLIVEDLVMVFALVLLPALAGSSGNLGWTLLLTCAKVAGFIAFMMVVGRRAIPWALHWVAQSGSRELFRLSVLAIALGVAFGAALLFGVSFALGAFFAGMILAESPLSQRAAEETLPLRDAFSVLFFVSVGMLFNPHILVTQPLPVAMTVAIIILGKSIAAYGIVRLFGKSNEIGLTIAVSLAQIGEFSFILATLGTSLKLIPGEARDLILAGAILSIMLNPLMFWLVAKVSPKAVKTVTPPSPVLPQHGDRHVVLIGYGRVGRSVGQSLIDAGQKLVVVEDREDIGTLPRDQDNCRLVIGNAADAQILSDTDLTHARMLIVAVPNAFEAAQIVQQAREINPDLHIVVRAHADDEVDHLTRHGADVAIMGEREIARRMIEQALPRGATA